MGRSGGYCSNLNPKSSLDNFSASFFHSFFLVQWTITSNNRNKRLIFILKRKT